MDDYDFYDDYHPDEWEDEFEEECGLMPDGQCAMAGTEHCDWDCGKLNAQRIEAINAHKPEGQGDGADST